MFATRKQRPGQRRRGIVLLVVLTMLTLFALVGVSFVLVASSQESSARIAREAETNFKPSIDPEAAFAFALGQLIYDLEDNTGGRSGLWGHSLARNLYGWNAAAVNDKPYSGFGRVRNSANPMAPDELRLMSFQAYPDRDSNGARHPERFNGAYFPSAAVTYTYPDHNNFYLAQIDPSTGQVLTPSFHREYLFGRLDDPNNPNWNNASTPLGKFKTLRPTSGPNGYHPNFPMPLDRGGDVKNLDGAPGGCDSIWIDIGAPVITAPDGTLYKMLIAPLILDLDGRLNLNVVGNLLGTSGAAHRSNQGWGPWEVNPARVLNDANAAGEWLQLFNGSPTTGPARYRGRYDGNPNRGFLPANRLPGGRQPRAWAQVDYNGAVDTGAGAGNPSNRLAFPTPSQPGAYTGFPTFPTDSYSNGNVENTNHASVYNAIRPNQRNRLIPLADMARLLRQGGTGSDMLTSELMRLLPTNLSTGNDAAVRRNMVTLLSADLDRPAIVPYFWNDTTLGMGTSSRLLLNWPNPAPEPQVQAAAPTWSAQQLSMPPLGNAPANSEFDANWHSTLLALPRIDLKRNLPNYPVPDANTGVADAAGSQTALAARQAFARDIFYRLAGVTGHRVNLANDNEIQQAYTSTMPAGRSPEYRAIRALAQLAVNMVDYIDSDDISTVFQIPGSGEFVYGFEQPRLVINEVYASIDNYKPDVEDNNGKRVRMGGNYHLHIWAELMNPLINDNLTGSSNPDCTANLRKSVANSEANYRLLVVDADPNPATIATDYPGTETLPGNVRMPPVTALRRPDNPGGTIADDAGIAFNDDGMNRTLLRVIDWAPNPIGGMGGTDPWQVAPLPAANRFSNAEMLQAPRPNPLTNSQQGFFVVGPNVAMGDYEDPDKDDPRLPRPTLATPLMTWIYPAQKLEDAITANKRPRPMLVLQRLANPHLPHQADASIAGFNPYITIDYFDCRPEDVIDARRFNLTGDITGAASYIPLGDRTSVGRNQPYAACWSERRNQRKPSRQPDMTVNRNMPQHTFFYQNAAVEDSTILDTAATDQTLRLPFDWLVHLDRMPISPSDILHTSALRPFDVLQYFVVNGLGHQHKAPWLNADTRLSRFLEFVSRSSYAGLAVDDPSNPTQTAQVNWGTPNGRIPGLINLNTMPWSVPNSSDANNPISVFRALCDANAANGAQLTDAQVDSVLATLLDQRTPATTTGDRRAGPTDPRLLGGDFTALNRPFVSLGIGTFNNTVGTDTGPPLLRGMEQTLLRNNSGIKQTLLRNNNGDPAAAPLLDLPDPGMMQPPLHPYARKELLTKIFNNCTTRSNTFAVWITVGFFRVVDTSVNPPRLGEEVGKSENRHVRYRMFALVDRTRLQIARGQLSAAVNPGSDVTIAVQNLTGHQGTAAPAALQNGTVLILDPGQANEEAVVIRNANGLSGTVNLRFSHGANAEVSWPGNPGPIPRYDPRFDTEVVPHWALID